MSRLFAIIAVFVAATFAAAAQDAPRMTISAKADSVVLVQGDRVNVHVEVVKNGHAGTMLAIPEKEHDYYGLDLSDCLIDSTDLGNNRMQLNYEFTFQAFDPNEELTVPFEYVVGADTLRSDPLVFKVLPVELDPVLGDPAQPDSLKIFPDEPAISIKSKWYDYIPDWSIWILVGVLVVAAAVVIWMLYRKNGPAIFVKRKPVPPYDLAIGRLNKLRDKRLIENGLGKEFYTEVTDIWRSYLDGRFGIQAMEMTSNQILNEIRDHSEISLTADQMENILRTADFVKFAALNPTHDEMRQAFNSVYSFVESTRPAEEEKTEGTDTNENNKVNKK